MTPTSITLPFELSDEQRMLREAVRDFAAREIAPVAAALDESGEFPLQTVRKMAEMGLMGIEVPEAYGGAGMDGIAAVLAIIEIAKADAAHSTVISVNNSLIDNGLLWFGTEAQRQNYLVPIVTGAKIGAYALTEPQSGSDAAGMQTRAVLNDAGTHYLLNGRKSWVSAGPVADIVLTFAITDPAQGHRGITAFLLDADRPGFRRGKKEPKLGIRASATSELLFENYACPVENVLGAPGEGFKIAMTLLDAGRIGIASQAVGIAEAAYEAAVAYARAREAFGQKIGEFQMIQQKIADMKTRLEAARLLTFNAALAKMRAVPRGERYTTEASMAKLFASETAMFAAHQSVQIHGGIGYSKELPIERYFRDAKITEIYEGTSEIQRMVIARNELGVR